MTPPLLLDDTPSIAPLALAHELGWVMLPLERIAGLTAQTAQRRPEALLFAPVAEYPDLQQSYTILPTLVGGGNYNAAIVLVADRPLEEIDACAVDLADSSRTAEALARGTLRKFYGLNPVAWLRDERPEDPNLPVVEIREGGEALHLLDEPGNRVVVELGRAWFILTGLPPVTHLLLAPDALLRADPDAPRAVSEAIAVANTVLRDRRDDLRQELSTRYGVSLPLLNRYYDDQFAALTGDGQKSVRALFTAIARSMALPPVAALKLPPGVSRA
ncbi:MAG: MqnA/MqnD/SBP family protein [Chloroflexia bacterium]